ncbi:Gfo/Idh/MocA family oxidoreductase [Salinibacterium sp. NSLL150]|uniref:Gfo/Idh/MocA family protein n=1 Tax=unclassified Salinibacterium TaxID=2632331 RepID=UPI0018CFE541|nr:MULTISPECIES: Gfo/Idh/MocA family oxidoreductase [unclassified Salinibacterium]MBH0097590.1 Gfo/Idh/MocA family oxidoreductase [Salinibacterium sp. NSLL35]MBH0100345.1 Gfo/Idh/MocA family oxidoreductase [Salinibacterium sp. NSLL150]MBH0103104.1 Gfo/Idh/MocA family oxidoreductase [Salinibacterium sp. NSLL16]MBH0105865.1 Gfo/Idh/MocA family oxidoreductase [Salinibacterium sp. NSLL17]MBH0110361.1 Gfo/Idh/MocA family oxidoreductase [Salinibacterium sp. NG22]
MASTAVKTIGIGLIGDGLMAKEHSMAWRNVRAVFGDVPLEPRLVTLVHPTLARAETAAAQYGFERASDSWKDVVNDPEIDVINIVTPNAFHEEVAIAAARAGKHVWCEKPLALSVEGALAMTEAAEAAGITTQVGFTYLQNPGIALARHLVDAGELGQIISFTGFFSADTMIDPDVPFTWRTDRSRAGGGALGDLGSHMISIARHLVGGVARVSGMTKIVVPERTDADGVRHVVDNDDYSLSLLEFANGAIGSMHASRVAVGRAFEVSFTLTGTRGAIRFSQQDSHKLEVSLDSDGLSTHGFRTIELGEGHGDYADLWPMSGINIGLHELKIFEVKKFIDAIAAGTTSSPDFREAWEIQKVIEAVETSDKQRAWCDVP